jgi:WD40 repeat protein
MNCSTNYSFSSSNTHTLKKQKRLAFSPCGRSLWGLTSAGDALLRFDAEAGRLLQRIANPHRHSCSAFAFACGGSLLVTGGGDGLVKVWQLPEGGGGSGGGVVEAASGEQQQQQQPFAVEERHPPHKAFVGHPGALRGAFL